MKKNLLLSFVMLCSLQSVAISPQSFQKKPKLIVFLVFDQMRADYLTRFHNLFLPSEKSGEPGGFRFLTEKGAYFPYAQYDVLQNMTCPGHTMISTGSWPINNGISINEWYDRETKKIIYCVDDPEFEVSPRSIKTSTLSDEVKNADIPSKVIGISLKDRSAIALAGHRADGAYWFDLKKWGWVTSKYYNNGTLPSWVAQANKKLSASKPDANLLGQPWGVETTIDLALQALKSEKLGTGSGTDFLFLSFSTHDIAGHAYGPNSQEMKDLTIQEDKQISVLLKSIKKQLGSLKDVNIVLTADHGIAPSVDYSVAHKISARRLDDIEMIKSVYEHLNQKFNIKNKAEWIETTKLFHFYLNKKTIADLKLDEDQVLSETKMALLKIPGVSDVLITKKIKTQSVLLSKQIKSQIENSFIESQWGDLILIPDAFVYNKGSNLVTHMTGYSYDRTVPLIFWGGAFKPGVYLTSAKIVDLTPTLTAILGVIPTAKVDGRVLNEIIKEN